MNRKLYSIGIVSKKNGKGGGPYESSERIIKSNSKNQFIFSKIDYDSEIGRKISFKRIKHLIEQIKSKRIEIVYFSGLQLEGFHIAVAAFISKRKSLVVVRGFSGDDKSLNPFKRILMTFILEPITLILINKHYSNSEYTSERLLLKIFKRKSLGVIYNYLPPKVVENKLSTKNKLRNNKLKVLIVSRITPEKGFKNLSKIISQINSKDIEFTIVGDGEYRSTFESSLKSIENVIFTGIIQDVSKYYNESDVLLHPSLHETLGNVLLEASINKVPIIASKVGGIPEIVIHNQTGFLVEPNDIDGFVMYLKLLKENQKLRSIFGENGYKYVSSKFSTKLIEEKINIALESLINKNE